MSKFAKYWNNTVAHWTEPVNDGYGKYTHSGPFPFFGRWTKRTSLVANREGSEVVSSAYVLTDSDEIEEIKEGEYLKIVEDSSSIFNYDSSYWDESENDPENLAGARKVVAVKETFDRTAKLKIMRIDVE